MREKDACLVSHGDWPEMAVWCMRKTQKMACSGRGFIVGK